MATTVQTLLDQVAIPEAFTADFSVVRALLQKDRGYEQAVELFRPYREMQQPDPPTRNALRQIAERALRREETALFFVNNRLEGYAPGTIEAVAAAVDLGEPPA